MEIFKNHPQWNDVKKICTKLKENGFTAWLAGGCVRDGLLGIVPKDFDIATNARPKKIEGLFNKTVDVGKAFGVIRVIEPSGDIEVATFRKDGLYIDGRHPTTVELSTPQEDAKRRDFTINALFYDLFEDQIHDFVEGQQDLQKRLIRAVGMADDRFMEDKLRILRAVRFVSQLDFELEKSTYDAILPHASAITQVSVERIADEMDKLFEGVRPDKAVKLLNETGLLQILFPEIHFEPGKEKIFNNFQGEPNQIILEWMNLFEMVPDSSQHEAICRRLRFSNDKIGTVTDSLELVTSFHIF
jgi:tRNA nucleotidyltransferase (CCA-adding enzyme)